MPAASNGFSSKRKGLSRKRCWTFAPFPGRKAAMKKAPFVAAALATAPLALTPNPADAQPGNSAPGLSVGPHVVPLPADTPYPGTMALKVDATDVARGTSHVHQTIPGEQAGKRTLPYTDWLPAKPAPRGALSSLTGFQPRAAAP